MTRLIKYAPVSVQNYKIRLSKNYIEKNIYEDISNYKRKIKKKISSEDFIIPNFDEYMNIVNLNYNVKQLKEICKKNGLKIAGNKTQLKFRTFNYLKYSCYSIKIQKIFRGSLVRLLNKLKGPAFKNRKCVNETDFLIFEEIKKINPEQFFSYKDKDNFIYGFNICSLYNLLFVENKGNKVKNPYNRNLIEDYVYNNIKNIIKISKILNLKTNIVVKNDINLLSFKKKIELKCTDVFQLFDELGNTCQSNWFYDLSRPRLLKFINELIDIWQYRLNLPNDLKKQICYPGGNPFEGLNLQMIFSKHIDKIRNGLLNVIKNFVTKGRNRQDKALGAYYVLGALTLVSHNAATSLPWLYETFRYD